MGHPFNLSGIGEEGRGPRSGSHSVFIKNQSEPDFGPHLPVLPTKHESVQERPERGPSQFFRFLVFLETTLAVGFQGRPEGPNRGPRPEKLGIPCTSEDNSFFVFG